MKVAYIVSRFPKLTETFILFEILALDKQGVQIALYPLLRPRATAVHPEGAPIWKKVLERFSKSKGVILLHPEAAPLVERAYYSPFLSWPILKAQIYFLSRKPKAYLGTIWTLFRETWGSWNFFLGSLTIYPKTVYFAERMVAEGITHIHAHFANHPAAAAFIVHRLTDIPYSFTAHGADLQVDQHMLLEKVSEAATVVTISNYNKEFIVSKCGEQFREKIRVIYCGVDTQVFKPRPEQEQTSSTTQLFKILCIATMYEVKGHTYLIEACRLLKDRGVNFKCQLIGDGSFRPTLTEQVIEAGLKDQVQFLGQLTRQEVVRQLQMADVLAMPSIPTSSGRREGIPVVLMEAMASGTPVVASAISGIPELVEDGRSGILVPPREPQMLADALQCLYLDPMLRQRIAKTGREKIARDFDLYKNAALLLEIFSKEGE